MTLVKRTYRPSVMDKAFDDMMKAFFTTPNVSTRPRYNEPAVNILSDDKAFYLDLLVPGLAKDDFTIKIDDKNLVVEAAKDHTLPEGTKVLNREFAYGHFTKTFLLPETVDVTKIEASYEAGILHITLHKTEESAKQVHEIKVN